MHLEEEILVKLFWQLAQILHPVPPGVRGHLRKGIDRLVGARGLGVRCLNDDERGTCAAASLRGAPS